MFLNKSIENQVPPSARKVISIIIFYFLLAFVGCRIVVYLVLGQLLPDFFLTIKGVHIHHFTYGVVVLVIVGLYLLLARPKHDSKGFINACIFYGIGLGFTFDEFGMWIRLEDAYWVRQSYDAIVVILLLLLNIAFFHTIKSFIKKELGHIWRMLKYFVNKK